jgi:hypothetical protein
MCLLVLVLIVWQGTIHLKTNCSLSLWKWKKMVWWKIDWKWRKVLSKVVDLVFLRFMMFFPKSLLLFIWVKRSKYTYMYKDIISLPKISINFGFQEEYWFGHRMNHCSGKKKNVETRGNHVLNATKKIKAGEEVFLDYNRDCFCRVCKKYELLLTQELPTFAKCSNCQERKRCFKMYEICKKFMCPSCYDYYQIKF